LDVINHCPAQQINAFLSICKIILKKKKKSVSKTTVFNNNIINDFSAENQHIRMISEGSCDSEDWSNDNFGVIIFDNF